MGLRLIYTYIIKTIDNEYYCGKTNNLIKRFKEHEKGKRNTWFEFKNRKSFRVEFITMRDYEKRIKRFGVEKFVECILYSYLPFQANLINNELEVSTP